MLLAALVVVACYLIGSIPFPVIVSRLVKGIDIREHGSGNMGAANTGRVLGKKWFVVVFLLDFIKGAGSAYLAQRLLPGFIGTEPTLAAAIGGMVAVTGHCFPIYVGFKGGLGLAASAGALVLISPVMLAAVCASILLFWYLAKNMYVGVAAAAAVAPVYTYLILHRWDLTVAVIFWAGLVVALHLPDVQKWWAQRGWAR